jgi:hypothetical protein
MNLAVIWRFLLFACELMHIFHMRKNIAIITLKIRGATLKNWVALSQGFCIPGLGYGVDDWVRFSTVVEIFQTGTVSRPTVRPTHLSSVYEQLFLPFIFVVWCLTKDGQIEVSTTLTSYCIQSINGSNSDTCIILLALTMAYSLQSIANKVFFKSSFWISTSCMLPGQIFYLTLWPRSLLRDR